MAKDELESLTDGSIGLIHCGLTITNERAVRSMEKEIWRGGGDPGRMNFKQMAREVRRLRGDPDPDLV